MTYDIKINYNLDGIYDFMEIFSCKDSIYKGKIEKLFEKNSYKKLVGCVGQDFDMEESYKWVDLFYEAYELLKNDKEYEGFNAIKKNVINSVMSAIKNVDKLEEYCENIIEVIKTKEFIKKAMYYLPNLKTKTIELNINFYVFMYNAAVENLQVFIDIMFANLLTVEQCTDLLAHEMHHYLQRYIDNEELILKDDYKDIKRMLFVISNEGTADMCNFISTNEIYEKFGWMEKGCLDSMMENVEFHMKKLNNLLEKRLDERNKNVDIISFINENHKYHVLGYHMAKTIEKGISIEELRSCIGKPLRFILSYNEAYKKLYKEYMLSDFVVDRLKNVRRINDNDFVF